MARNTVVATKLTGGLGRRNPSTDGVQGAVIQAVAIADDFEYGSIHELRSIEDLEAKGVDQQYDLDNKVLVWNRIDRWFKRNPGGELHLMPVSQATTLANMADKDLDWAAKLSKQLNGRIKVIWLAMNPDDEYAPTNSGGLDGAVLAALPKAQGLVNDEADKFRYLDAIIVEGRGFNGTAASAGNLRNLTYPNVHVVIGQDWDLASEGTEWNNYAAVEEFAGMAAAAAVSQNVGERIDLFALTDTINGLWLNPGLSNHELVKDTTDSSLTTLHDKGYIFGEFVTGLNENGQPVEGGTDGCWWNDAHSCIELASDFAYLENNRTINKMIRISRGTLLPRVNSRLRVDPVTGYLQTTDKVMLESSVEEKVGQMTDDGDLSGGVDCYIDPEQNLLSTSNLEVKVTAVPLAIARRITLSVGLTNPFKTN